MYNYTCYALLEDKSINGYKQNGVNIVSNSRKY